MPQKIINLTLQVVIQEIENVFDDYFHHPARQAFAIPELRQKLIAYVLNRIRSRYIVIEDEQDVAISHKFPCSQEQRLHIEAVIKSGIQHILQENSDWVSHHTPETVESGYFPCQWFN